ncbi:MAG: prepilin-type N-terminal cleavage/methylation domain-containing protein [Puniceicoccales bacterium]
MDHRSKISRGFTLIELLAIIAVIGILFGIVIASMSSSRSSASRIKCMGNMRQLGLAMRMYANDHHGYLPKPQGNFLSENHPSVSWMIMVGEYLNLRFPEINQDTFFLCPEALNTYPGGNARRTYAINAAGTDGKTAANLMTFEDPARTALLYDSASASTIDGYSVFGINTFEQNIEWRHDDGANVLMVDGHVEHLKRSEVDTLEQYVRNFFE